MNSKRVSSLNCSRCEYRYSCIYYICSSNIWCICKIWEIICIIIWYSCTIISSRNKCFSKYIWCRWIYYRYIYSNCSSSSNSLEICYCYCSWSISIKSWIQKGTWNDTWDGCETSCGWVGVAVDLRVVELAGVKIDTVDLICTCVYCWE
jgi:hypothetical protein